MKKKDCPKGVVDIYPYLKEEWRALIEKQPPELLRKATEVRIRCGKGCS